MDHADEETKQAVKQGKKTINRGYTETRNERKSGKEPTPKSDSVFNAPDNIGWAKWTWNPVTGCKHGCKYCYARDFAMRFAGHFNPTFHPEFLKGC